MFYSHTSACDGPDHWPLCTPSRSIFFKIAFIFFIVDGVPSKENTFPGANGSGSSGGMSQNLFNAALRCDYASSQICYEPSLFSGRVEWRKNSLKPKMSYTSFRKWSAWPISYGTWSIRQKMCASSCWKRRTRVRPVNAPLSSFRCNTPKSAYRIGNSLYEWGCIANMIQWPGQFIGFKPYSSFSHMVRNIFYAYLSQWPETIHSLEEKMLGDTTYSKPRLRYCLRCNYTNVLKIRAPCGSQNALPGDTSLNKKSCCWRPIIRWSRLAASSCTFFHYVSNAALGKEMP